jgi:chorismate--pyruvate lyase
VKEPVWHDAGQWQRKNVPDFLRVWLFDNASLTQRLRLHCDQQLSVDILTQLWARPFPTESKRLYLPIGRYAKIREVYLCCHHQPWIFARTIIPESTLLKIRHSFARLKARPLGEGLFDSHNLYRNQAQIAQLDNTHFLYHLAVQNLNNPPNILWGRRSLLYLFHKPLLITEVFLPFLSENQGVVKKS